MQRPENTKRILEMFGLPENTKEVKPAVLKEMCEEALKVGKVYDPTQAFIPLARMQPLNRFAKVAALIATAKGFNDVEPSIHTAMTLINEELNEVMECYEKGEANDICEKTGCRKIEVELADIIIRTLNLCGYMDIDINKAVVAKMLANCDRPYKWREA